MAFSDSDIINRIHGTPMAGGVGYTPSVHPKDADIEVDNYGDLKKALNGNHDVIAVANGAKIRLKEDMGLDLGDKTLVSYRGIDGKAGALLYSAKEGYYGSRPFTPMYSDGSPHVSGFRIRGASHARNGFHPSRDRDGNTVFNDTLARAIMLRGPGGEIENCEMWGWMWNAVHVKGDYGKTLTKAKIHHCHIHKSLQVGYGYGVDIKYGFAHVHDNYFNECRHCVDGFGWEESGFIVEDNIFGPDQYSHAVDMHCLAENGSSKSKTNPDHPRWALRAGGELYIRNNQFCFGEGTNGIAIRGVPKVGVWISGNRFPHPEPGVNEANSSSRKAWRQVNVRSSSYGRFPRTEDGYSENWYVQDNHFGVFDLVLDFLEDFWEQELYRRELLYRRLKELRDSL